MQAESETYVGHLAKIRTPFCRGHKFGYSTRLQQRFRIPDAFSIYGEISNVGVSLF